MMRLQEPLVKALLAHAQGEIEKHKANVLIYFSHPVGIGDHPDVTQAFQDELDKIARYEDQIEVLNKYFK